MNFVIADDHALVREGVVNTLKGFISDLSTIEVEDGKSLIKVLEQSQSVDLILFDLSMPDTNAYEVIRCIADNWPDIPLIVLSAESDAVVIHKTIHLGASGFIPKSVASDEMISAIRTVLKGGVYLPRSLPKQAVSNVFSGKERKQNVNKMSLTRRQKEVITLLAEGKTNRLIGEQLGLSERTIKVHITKIYKMLDVSNRTEALNKLRKLGIMPLEIS